MELTKLDESLTLTERQHNKGTGITFVKGDYRREKTRPQDIFDRMFYNANFKSEIIRINNDIKKEFQNLMRMGVSKNELATISEVLFNQLMLQIDKGNAKYIEKKSAPEFARKELIKISETQSKIYKVLKQIEEDLIDEQDTKIRSKTAGTAVISDDRINDLIDEKLKGFAKEQAIIREKESKGMFGFLFDIGLSLGTSFLGSKLYDDYKARKAAKDPKSFRDYVREAKEKLAKNAKDFKENFNKGSETQKPSGQPKPSAPPKPAPPAPKPLGLPAPNAPSAPSAPAPGAPNLPSPNSPAMPNRAPNPVPANKPSAFQKFLDGIKNTKLREGFAKHLGKFSTVLNDLKLLSMLIHTYLYGQRSFELYPDDGWLDGVKRAVYTLTASCVTWTAALLTAPRDINVLLIALFKFMAEYFTDLMLESDSTIGKSLSLLMSLYMDWIVTVLSKILEYVVAPITDFAIEAVKRAYKVITLNPDPDKPMDLPDGDEVGKIAVQFLEDNLERFKTNLPNGVTWEMLTDSNKTLKDMRKRGLYDWNKFGLSKLEVLGGAETIAERVTGAEIDELLKHDDLDSVVKLKLQKAREIQKQKGITDLDVARNNYTEPYLIALSDVLDTAGGAFEESWRMFVRSSIAGGTKEYIMHYGVISATFYDHKVREIHHGSITMDEKEADDATETLLNRILSRFKGRAKFRGYSYGTLPEELCFSVFGTVFIQYMTKDIPYNAVNRNININTAVKIIGYIDKSRQFHADKINPSDEIIKSIISMENPAFKRFYNNIIYDESLKPAIKEEKIPELKQEKTNEEELDKDLSKSANPDLIPETGEKPSDSDYYDPTKEAREYKGNDQEVSESEYFDPTKEAREYTENPELNLTPETGEKPSDSGSFDPTKEAREYNPENNKKKTEKEPQKQQTQQNATSGGLLDLEALRKARIFKIDGKWHSDNPFVDAIMQIESRRNERAFNKSGAKGLFQFIPGTAKEMKLADPYDPYDSLRAFKQYVERNVRWLKKKNVPITPTNVYLTHQQGPGGLPYIYNALKAGREPDKYRGNILNNTIGGPKKFVNTFKWYKDWNDHIAKLMRTAIPLNIPAGSQTQEQKRKATSESAASPELAASPKTGERAQDYSEQPKKQKAGDAGKAASYAASHVLGAPDSVTQRVNYVANALESAGFHFEKQQSAYMYHTKGILKKMGFQLAHTGQKDFIPRKGDVAVINRYGEHQQGHISIFDGQNWVSDIRQNSVSPFDDAPQESDIWIYRYQNPELNADYRYADNNNILPGQNDHADFRPPEQRKELAENIVYNVNIGNNNNKHSFKEGDAELLFKVKLEELT